MKPFPYLSRHPAPSSLLAGSTAFALAVTILSASGAQRRVPADYPNIQAAVEAAADGDTIQIAPGVYTNQVIIDEKKLSLIGQSGTILRATKDLSLVPWPGENHFPILYIRLSEVTLRGLIFEGERLAGHYEGPVS